MSDLVQVSFRVPPSIRSELFRRSKAAGQSNAAWFVAQLSGNSECELFRRAAIGALQSLREKSGRETVFWFHVARFFGLGPTHAEKLCDLCGFNPETGDKKGDMS